MLWSSPFHRNSVRTTSWPVLWPTFMLRLSTAGARIKSRLSRCLATYQWSTRFRENRLSRSQTERGSPQTKLAERGTRNQTPVHVDDEKTLTNLYLTSVRRLAVDQSSPAPLVESPIIT